MTEDKILNFARNRSKLARGFLASILIITAISVGVFSAASAQFGTLFDPRTNTPQNGDVQSLWAPSSTFANPNVGQAHLVATVNASALHSSTPSSKLVQIPLQSRLQVKGLARSSFILGAASTLGSLNSFSVSTYTGFNGLSEGCCDPPDVQVAAGPSHVVEWVNNEGGIFSKQGILTKTFNLWDFFNTGCNPAIAGCNGIGDPNLLFDGPTGRWFGSIFDTTPGFGVGNVTVAVSTTSDPTATWKIYTIVAIHTFPDQPVIGVSDDKFVISANDFDVGSRGAQVWILSKNEMVLGLPIIDLVSFGPNSNLESVHPARSLSTTSTEYMVTVGIQATNQSQVFAITGSPPGPVIIRTTALSISPVSQPPAPLEPDGVTHPIDSDDLRIQSASWFQGKLWFTLNDACIPVGDNQTRSCVRLTEIDTTSLTVKQDFDIGANTTYYFYPALSIDETGNIAVVFGYSGLSSFPSLAVTGQAVTDPSDSWRRPQTLVTGTKVALTGRFGDYFGAGVDPSNQTVVWVAGEYDSSAVPGWSSFISSMRVVGLGFSISTGPTYLTVLPNSANTTAVRLTSLGGFSGNVSLTMSVPPGGLSTSLSQNRVMFFSGQSATSTLTISASPSTLAGTYTVTLTGSNGSLSVPANAIVFVKGFTLSAAPSNFTITSRNQGSSNITLTSFNGFAGTIAITTSLSPAGPSVTVTPTSVVLKTGGANSSTLTVKARSATPVGLYVVNVTGASGPQFHSILIPIALTPISININNSATFTGITVKTSGTISVDSPASSLTVSGTVAIVGTNTTTGGSLFSTNYTISKLPISASSGAYQSMFLLNVAVSPYRLASEVIVSFSGTATTTSLQVTRNPDIDGNGLVGQPDLNILLGVFGCSSTSSCYNPQADLNADGIVNGYDLSILLRYFGALDIFPDFSASTNRPTLTIGPGSQGASTITVTSVNGFTGTVNLSMSITSAGLNTSPASLSTSLSSTSIVLTAGGTGTSTLTVSSPTTGDFTVDITTIHGPLVHPVIVAVHVVDFGMAASPTGLSVKIGSSTTSQIILSSLNGLSTAISLSATISPVVKNGPSVTLGPTSVTTVSGAFSASSLTISTASKTPTGSYTIIVSGASVGASHSVSIALTVTT